MSGLDQTAEAYLRAGGREVSYADGQTIIHRGREGTASYLVLAGRAEVLLEAEDGQRLPLARLLPGATFGEMALLTDQPISADVVARGAVTVLEYPGELFQRALAECAALRSHILAGICASLRRTSTKAWGFFQRSEALRALMHTEEVGGEVIAESSAMGKVRRRIADLAPSARVALVSGAPGAGKRFAARKIHEAACGPDAAEVPLIVMDCLRLGRRGEAARLLFGPGEDRQFAPASGAAGELPLPGALDLADGGTLILQHVDALDAEAQSVLGRYLRACADGARDVTPSVRVIATTSKDLPDLARGERFDADLAGLLSAETLVMPALLSRRRDILPLAGLFLRERDRRVQDGEHRLNTSAEHALLSAEYRHRNAAELRDAVEFGAVFAEGPEIGSEHIFTGPTHEETRLEYRLDQNAWVRWLLDKGGLTAIKGVTLLFFAAIVVLCLVAGSHTAGRVANGLVWGLWWPLLMLLFLFVGRVWCTICPLSLAGRLVRRAGSLARTPPQWMKRHTTWVLPGLFVLIIWSEHVFEMTRRPFATGILLLVLMGSAVVLCLLYQRETWCRYLCPLGGLAAGYSTGAMVHVRANPSVCAAQCTTHECFKGGETGVGCSVFHHPMYARDGQFCKLCMTCLRSCPHESVKLYIRPLLQGIWRLGSLSGTLVPFALVMVFLAMVMLASHKAEALGRTGWYTAAVVAAVAAGLAGRAVLFRFLGRGGRADPAAVAAVAFALLVLAAGPLMAFHIENVPALGAMRVTVPSAAVGPWPGEPVHVPVLAIVQVSAVVLAAVLAAVALWRVRVRFAERGIASGRPCRIALRAVCLVYVLAALGLVMLRGRHA